jgi:hypothetical protein
MSWMCSPGGLEGKALPHAGNIFNLKMSGTVGSEKIHSQLKILCQCSFYFSTTYGGEKFSADAQENDWSSIYCQKWRFFGVLAPIIFEGKPLYQIQKGGKRMHGSACAPISVRRLCLRAPYPHLFSMIVRLL